MKMASELVYEQDLIFDVTLDANGSDYHVVLIHTPTGKTLADRGNKIRDVKAILVQKLERDLFGESKLP